MERNESEVFGTDMFDPVDAGGLTVPQVNALECLLSGGSQKQAAKVSGRSVRWVWGQLHREGAFQKAYQSAIQAKASLVRQQAIDASGLAIDSLKQMASDTSPPMCLKACGILLRLSLG